MPFTAILKELVFAVEGAEGAIVIEADGEAVQWFARGNEELLRLRAAYVALAAQASRNLIKSLGLTNNGAIVIRYENAGFVVAELESSYLLILELDRQANVAQALFRIKGTEEKLLAVM